MLNSTVKSRAGRWNKLAWLRMLSLCLLLGGSHRAFGQLKCYDTRYYTIYTDIAPEDEKEAAIRMTRMAEEYHERTKSFSGVIRTRFPFYLFKSPTDYYAAGGMPGSAGVFMYDQHGGKLMAVAGKKTSQDTWHVVQHEGFHQFAHAVIGGTMPIWLDEGLAEYFGESIFTGDGFVTGVIPPWRLSRLKTEIADKKLMALNDMMVLVIWPMAGTTQHPQLRPGLVDGAFFSAGG